MNRPALTVSVLLVLLAAPFLRADESVQFDYSKETLLMIFRDLEEQARAQQREVILERLEMERGGWVFRFLPLVLPIRPSDFSGNASVMPVVSPFALLGVAPPLLDDPALDSTVLSDEGKRYRKRMIAFVKRANRADNSGTE